MRSTHVLGGTTEAADRVWILVIEHVVIDLLLLAVEYDLAHHAMAFVELRICHDLAICPTGTVDAETIQGVAQKGRRLTRITLVKTLP